MNIDLLDYGYTVCKPDWRAEWQSMFHHKVYFCESGTAFYTVDGVKTLMHHNCFYIFPIFSRCEIAHDNNNAFKVLWLHINTTPALSDNIVVVNAKEGYYKNIASALKEGISKSEEVVHSLSCALLEALITDKLLNACYDEGVSYILNYINNNCGEKLTNEILADKISYSKNHFIQLFKKHTGLSPHLYIKLFRLEKAKQHLQNGNSVADTATLCGYSSQSVLSREIKNHYGILASEIKKQRFTALY